MSRPISELHIFNLSAEQSLTLQLEGKQVLTATIRLGSPGYGYGQVTILDTRELDRVIRVLTMAREEMNQ